MRLSEKASHHHLVPATHGVAERFQVAFLEASDELRPRREAHLARDGELRVGELELAGRLSGVGADRAQARESVGGASARITQEILGELALLVEVKRGGFSAEGGRG